jgi:hypothetical protein
MRRMPAAATMAALLLAASVPGMASAAAPERVSDTQTDLSCDITVDAGTVSLWIGVSDTYGTYAQLAFWATPAGPFDDPPTWFSIDGSAELSADGSSLAASFNLVEYVEPVEPEGIEVYAVAPSGDPIGTATLAATLSAVGDPESFSHGDRDGNRRYTVDGTFQQLAADGLLQLPADITFEDLSACWAGRTTTEAFATNPDTWVSRSADRSVSCVWEGEDFSVGLYAVSYEGGTFSEIYIGDATGFASGYTESATLTTEQISAFYALETYDELTDTWTPAGSADASATLTAGDRVNELSRYGNEKIRVDGVVLSVDGLLTIETGAATRTLPMDDASCFAQDITVQFIVSSPDSGRGPALANDSPDGALALDPGDAIRVRTGGTAVEAEAACTLTEPEYGEIPIPIGHTVWYSVAGTGGEITLDTAGSEFDTVLGVYTSDGSVLTQVACVDDVVSEEGGTLQAALTFASEDGVTYFVQAGGYGETSGTMYLSVD